MLCHVNNVHVEKYICMRISEVLEPTIHLEVESSLSPARLLGLM